MNEENGIAVTRGPGVLSVNGQDFKVESVTLTPSEVEAPKPKEPRVLVVSTGHTPMSRAVLFGLMNDVMVQGVCIAEDPVREITINHASLREVPFRIPANNPFKDRKSRPKSTRQEKKLRKAMNRTRGAR